MRGLCPPGHPRIAHPVNLEPQEKAPQNKSPCKGSEAEENNNLDEAQDTRSVISPRDHSLWVDGPLDCREEPARWR
jgi:hypothetical protein